MLFWPSIAIIIAAFLKRTAALETAVVPEKNKIYAHMFFLSFLYSGIPDLALGILKMLILICFCDVLQPAV